MPPTPVHSLRLVLRANAAFSFATGLIAVAAAPWLSDRLGIDHVTFTRVLGVGLLVFAADVAFVSRRRDAKLLAESLVVSAADLTWVVATIVVIAAGVLTTTGTVVAAVVAAAVADFGAAQLWFRSKAIAGNRTATLAV